MTASRRPALSSDLAELDNAFPHDWGLDQLLHNILMSPVFITRLLQSVDRLFAASASLNELPQHRLMALAEWLHNLWSLLHR